MESRAKSHLGHGERILEMKVCIPKSTRMKSKNVLPYWYLLSKLVLKIHGLHKHFNAYFRDLSLSVKLLCTSL